MPATFGCGWLPAGLRILTCSAVQKTHPELVCRLFALSFVSECVELSGRSQTVTVSQRPERDCNAEDLRTADDTSSNLYGCTGEYLPSLWFVVGKM